MPTTGAILVIGDNGGAVLNPRNGSVTLISSEVIRGGPAGLPLGAYDPEDDLVYVDYGGDINIVSPTTWSRVTQLPVSAESVAYDPVNQLVYFAGSSSPASSGLYSVNSTTFQVQRVSSVGANPQGVCVDPATGQVYVANEGSGNLSVFDPASGQPEASIDAGSDAYACTVDDASHSIYVSDYNYNGGYNGYADGSVTVINLTSRSEEGAIVVGDGPELPAMDSPASRLFVPNYGTSNVSVISTSSQSVVSTIEIASPMEVAFDPEDSSFY
ncbi:surface antigen-like protein, partial [mine drainage metagenome]